MRDEEPGEPPPDRAGSPAAVALRRMASPAALSIAIGVLAIAVPLATSRSFLILPLLGLIAAFLAVSLKQMRGAIIGIAVNLVGALISLYFLGSMAIFG